MADAFAALQAKLATGLEANRPGSTTRHVLIALPSYSVSESLLSHYGNRIPSLEHRYLNAIVIPARIETCEMVYISTRPPQPEVIAPRTDLDRRDPRGRDATVGRWPAARPA